MEVLENDGKTPRHKVQEISGMQITGGWECILVLYDYMVFFFNKSPLGSLYWSSSETGYLGR